MNFLELVRSESGNTGGGTRPLPDYERTRLATVISWSSYAKASELIGMCSKTIERAVQGDPVHAGTERKIVAAIDGLYDALEPASIHLCRALSAAVSE